MIPTFAAFAFAAWMVLAWPGAAWAQALRPGGVAGRVVDGNSGEPVRGVVVYTNGYAETAAREAMGSRPPPR